MKHAIVFGRFNPPTIGHSLLLKTLNKYAKEGNKATVFLSHSINQPVDFRRAFKKTKDVVDKEEINKIISQELRNPLSWEQKVSFVDRVIQGKGYDVSVDETPTLTTLEKIFVSLAEAGDRNIILIAGSDRVEEFNGFVERYNNAQPADFHVRVEIVSAGKRDPDADDVSGISATMLRYLALAEDFDAFQQGIDGDKDLAWDIYNAVQEGLSIPDEFKTGRPSKVEEEDTSLRDYLWDYILHG